MDDLTDNETDALVMNIVRTMHPKPVSESELMKVLKWAHGVRVGSALLDLCLKDKVGITLVDGELVFGTADRES